MGNKKNFFRSELKIQNQKRSLASTNPQEYQKQYKLILERVLKAFPNWDNVERKFQHVVLHIGLTNSGKTYQAINDLATMGSGWYLSPLRLLAYEVFDALNKRSAPCNLLTGEEAISIPGATITSATIEMFDPTHSGECVIIDEAYMLADSQRGWAWTRAIMETRSPIIHIIGNPVIEPLIQRLVKSIGIPIETISHERLVPLEVINRPWHLESLPPRTILVAFSRSMVLGLKSELEKTYNRSVSVVYGNLPPEVRLNQAARFASGQNEICVATDAIGMGLNLPADNVCFFETSKFDGISRRSLTKNEIRQIAGRAGRYGLSKLGRVGALSKADLGIIQHAIDTPINEHYFAHVSPSLESLQMIPGTLAEKLVEWTQMQSIPTRWKRILKPVDLSAQISLARQLSNSDVAKLGDEKAFKLINAPIYSDIEDYWLNCARAIIHHKAMPVPVFPPEMINSAADLASYETAIHSADMYLWLSQRDQFEKYAPQADLIRTTRSTWSSKMDAALQKKVDTSRRCQSCGRPIPLKHRYNMCEYCFVNRWDY